MTIERIWMSELRQIKTLVINTVIDYEARHGRSAVGARHLGRYDVVSIGDGEERHIWIKVPERKEFSQLQYNVDHFSLVPCDSQSWVYFLLGIDTGPIIAPIPGALVVREPKGPTHFELHFPKWFWRRIRRITDK